MKDPDARRADKAIARESGVTLTSRITKVLRERYQRLLKGDPEALAVDIRAIADPAAGPIK